MNEQEKKDLRANLCDNMTAYLQALCALIEAGDAEYAESNMALLESGLNLARVRYGLDKKAE